MMRRRSWRAFTLVEVVIALAVVSLIATVLMEVLTSETRTTAQLMDDLTLNKDARAILQAISRDVRSATEIPEDPANPDNTVAINPDLTTFPLNDERYGRLKLVFRAPAAEAGNPDLRRFAIEYRVVGRSGESARPPASLPNLRPKPYQLVSGQQVHLFPVVREEALITGTTVQVKQAHLLGWVRALRFYKMKPTDAAVRSASQPTVFVWLAMSAFKASPTGRGYQETYQEVLSTGLTARGIVPGAVGQL